MHLYQRKLLSVKRKLPSKKHLYIVTIKPGKKNYEPRNYKGISENTFNKRYTNHKRSFNINRYINDTKPSVEYWKLKPGNSNPKLMWIVKNQFSGTTLNQKDVPFV